MGRAPPLLCLSIAERTDAIAPSDSIQRHRSSPQHSEEEGPIDPSGRLHMGIMTMAWLTITNQIALDIGGQNFQIRNGGREFWEIHSEI